jgi:hypothetical protein
MVNCVEENANFHKTRLAVASGSCVPLESLFRCRTLEIATRWYIGAMTQEECRLVLIDIYEIPEVGIRYE